MMGLELSGVFTPLNVFLSILIVWLVKRLLTPTTDYTNIRVLDEAPTPIAQRDYTLEELREFNGVDNPKILVAIKGKVFDVSAKRNFYGPEGPYGLFAGRDASRALAKGDLSGDTLPTDWDVLEDLTAMEREQLEEWAQSFEMKYNIVGTLVKEHAEAGGRLDVPRGHSPTPSTGSNTWEMVESEDAHSPAPQEVGATAEAEQ